MLRPFLQPPVRPYRGTRQIDDFGAGGFGAPRERDGHGRLHKGIDFLGVPGDDAIAPLSARVTPPSGHAYADGDLRSLHLLGVGVYDGLRVVMLYVEPQTCDDSVVAVGDKVGIVQNVAAYHEAHEPGKRMDNHCHLEVYELVNGLWVLRDPAKFISIQSGR